jgi:hypothetical protein
MTTKDDLVKDLQTLALLRKQAETMAGSLNILLDDLHELPVYKFAEQKELELKQIKATISELESNIRTDASLADPLQIPDGISIKNFKVIRITDEKKAKAWAVTNAPSLLKLDEKKLEKAVENLELDWVQKGTETKAQIASNLSQYYE